MFAWLESCRVRIPNDGLCRYSLAGPEYCGPVGTPGEHVALGLRLWESFLAPGVSGINEVLPSAIETLRPSQIQLSPAPERGSGKIRLI
jgi:hypothetical protein